MFSITIYNFWAFILHNIIHVQHIRMYVVLYVLTTMYTELVYHRTPLVIFLRQTDLTLRSFDGGRSSVFRFRPFAGGKRIEKRRKTITTKNILADASSCVSNAYRLFLVHIIFVLSYGHPPFMWKRFVFCAIRQLANRSLCKSYSDLVSRNRKNGHCRVPSANLYDGYSLKTLGPS